ncbi:CocE/NonD family hydrolase [Chengkuizengella axinellae]|uniref:CocE/NonD family hydrolase n=1 Tax=Chengkuizengella axinellae TaxID=3064388 RepID=A0ABT9J310_9BACL|nr:CocE/NonD family hydrolase [Chengkuizengella sp. 2205SS18-9]MDP5275400.1 CocE/NonD family hydrolase [Chengkuizengella sp. 2205SS18-9]
METYLNSTLFHYYCAGVYEGKIQFKEENIMHAKVDKRRRTQMQENVMPSDYKASIPFQKIYENINHYVEAGWEGEEVKLNNEDIYQIHIQYSAVVENEQVVSQVWAYRNDTALDIVTVEGEIIAFVCPNRNGMEILVKEGYEKCTPLVVYDDPLLSKPKYGVNDLGTFLIPMRDGVKLATDVYLPEGIDQREKLPTILVRTCYDRNIKKEFFMHWVHKGYAVVNQDVRGRADSEGDLVPFYYERDDGSDTIDWIVSQEWSDGNVGMWGASYLGYVVVAAATSGHPNLKAVVDEVNVGSPFTDTVRRGGAVCSWPLLSWTLAQSVGTRTDFSIFAGETVSVDEVVEARPIKEIPQKIIGKNSGPWDIWSEHPEYDDFWRNCTYSERGDQVNVSMFVISGWYDGDSPGISETWRMLSEHDVPNRKLWLGPWEHNPNRARDYGGLNFSNDAVVYHYDVNVLRWFDRYLKGIENGIDQEPKATYYVVGDNEWKTSDNWTPEEAEVTPFYLGSTGRANSSFGDGTLSDTPKKESVSEDRYIYDPKQPVEFSGYREPENLNKIELRNDILVYTSEILTEDMVVAGELSAEIYASSTGKDTDWVITLSDVDEEGNSIRLSDYIMRAKYRNGFDQPEELTPGKVEKFEIFMQNMAYTFKRGHKLRFSITSSSKFIAFPNTNTGLNPYDDAEPIVVEQRVLHNEKFPSHIKLPLIKPHS